MHVATVRLSSHDFRYVKKIRDEADQDATISSTIRWIVRQYRKEHA